MKKIFAEIFKGLKSLKARFVIPAIACIHVSRLTYPAIAVKIFLSICICCFFVVSLLAAQDSLTISPLRMEISIDAGGYYENYYQVTNNYDGTVDVNISVAKKESYVKNKDISLDYWLFVDTASITLQKGETKSVYYKIQTSTNITGNISAQVSFTTRPPGNEMMQARMTLPIYVNIRGTEKVDFRIVDFRISEYFGKTLGTISIENKGNVHIMPKGFFGITKGKQAVCSGAIREGLIVFSGTTRTDFEFQVPESAKFEPGKYRMHITVNAKENEIRKTFKLKVDKNGRMKVDGKIKAK